MIAATVLAAGDSRRMGFPKALLKLHGKTFLQTILTKLRDAGINGGYVVLGREHVKIFEQNDLGLFEAVQNEEIDAGPVGSIRSVLRMVPEDVASLLVWPVDMPHVQTSTVRAIVNPQTELPIMVPVWRDRRGHPILLKRKIFQEILQLPLDGTVRDVVRSDAKRVHRVDVDDSAIVDSINTPEDYQRLLKRTANVQR